ncbi:MAG: PIG-L family deacetylase, partial [Cyclobacteriaceae bacterium]
MNKVRILLFITIIFSAVTLRAQAPKKYKASEIQQNLEKLNVLGSVLYVAAHPDDENTRMISYFANEEKMRTAYLSATRGDGGQNLIGSEIREKLGLIRTQELLAARRTDGGQQFFSRANDFGYSKHPDETFNIWDKQEVLKDFVWVIRKFRPDIMITRFSEKPGVTHGHHTASAILAREAFKLAGDKNAFPEQLKYVETWQPKKLFWNTSWWFYRNTGEKMDTTQFKKVDVGAYNPLLGLSYTEIASLSRSMHKSQGFGSTGSRGKEIEYLKQLEGED